MVEKRHLGEFEQMVMLAILHVGDGAYGLAIRQELEQRTGREVSHGAAYVTLERLVKKGLVETWMGEPTPQRGGRSKRHFSVTPAGVEALRESHRAMQSLRSGLEEILEGS
jgi:DNA-binding PadR family transcriptional regulator